ncbi:MULTISPECIES: L-serine ammonia-lyase [unclassified Novosphingobium]|uniref:L-serine ammonia-lyase n=1 Tax=unclassified Novosphingobium TaxID=2644732 RepID=UPI00146C3AB6|nr:MULTISPECIES: L-serine ammonia-lyase [unclassified Novosphingobium]NMN06521.1 L-serine dehydratase [Novosphingobium sp. SG919]NMN89031.1 L-serine dehydratase [Novosphingobium sp. SG916]
MTVSTFDLFKIGIGPSSSHTVGPMVAARRFTEALDAAGLLGATARVSVDLYGSLALTGKGHATDVAVILGLAGEVPATVAPDAVAGIVAGVNERGRVALLGRHDVAFAPAQDMRFLQRERQPYHSNAMALAAWDAAGDMLTRRLFYSVGGGFVLDEDEVIRNAPAQDLPDLPYPFASAAELIEIGEATGLTFAQIMLANELAWRSPSEVDAGLDLLADTMAACIDRGCGQTGTLPGGLNVRRRAAPLAQELQHRQQMSLSEPLAVLDWINLWAMAVNEENAAGGRVVTAPTNGAAGIIPAVLRYYERCYRGDRAGRRTFLLTAAAIGALYKRNASISGAEVGCQGEVGVACSMAAAGLTAALGGNNAQIENAAEIGMEHNLGLTCDPVGGLVQIPCIERNAMGAVKAIDASRLAMLGDGQHMVSLDKVIETMRQTGADMRDKYKETSLGGLAVNVVAVNVVEC